MRIKPAFMATILLLLSLATASAQGTSVVASTTWTAAYARAAGASQVDIIAPAELKHPPEYEIKPSDLARVQAAGLVVYAGYERFAQRLAETAGEQQVPTLEVFTDNAPENVKAQARRIAETLGTVPAYTQWAAEFDSLAEELRREVQAAYPQRRAVVHKMLRTYAEWLGFEIVGEFGPAEPSPAVITELAGMKPVIVIDNYHNPQGQAIADGAGAMYAQLINFPGKDGTSTIEDLYRYNSRVLQDARADTTPPDGAGGVNWPVVGGALAAGVLLVAGAGLFLRRRVS